MKHTNETGRSMVEMLGVLAIIGVLSVGGIAGYTRAMRSWKANEILDAANRLAVMVETEIATSNSLEYDGMAGTGKLAKLAGGSVKELTAYSMTHASTPSKVVAKVNDSALVTEVKEKLGCTSGTCKLSNTYTLDIQQAN